MKPGRCTFKRGLVLSSTADKQKSEPLTVPEPFSNGELQSSLHILLATSEFSTTKIRVVFQKGKNIRFEPWQRHDKDKGKLLDNTRLHFNEEHLRSPDMTKKYSMQDNTKGRIHFIRGSHRLAEMLQTHKKDLTCSYFMGGERVNFPWEKTAQFCRIIWQITWGRQASRSSDFWAGIYIPKIHQGCIYGCKHQQAHYTDLCQKDKPWHHTKFHSSF